MKPLIHLLVDFENRQPSPADVTSVRGDEHRLWLFHGPHQNKFTADMVVAWQPLGDRVRFVQSSKNGKNALDFHIAFYLGRLHEENCKAGRPARYVVVTGDGGFDALFSHMQGLECAVGRAGSIPEALALAATLQAPGSPGEGDPSLAEPPAVAIDDHPPATARPRKGIIKATPIEATSRSSKTSPVPRESMAADDVEKVVVELRAHPRNRPGDRRALERHVVSILGNKVTAPVARTVVDELERRKIVTFVGRKVEYRLPKAKSAS